MFIFQKQHSPLLRHCYCTMCRSFRSLGQKRIMSLVLWRHLDDKAACIFENETVVEKRGPLPWENVLNSKPTAATEPEVSKKCQTMFFQANTILKGQKNANLWRTCQTPFFQIKPLWKRPNFWNLASKMPTWQSWSR